MAKEKKPEQPAEPPPEMRRVEWGGLSVVVQADNDSDAWSAFCAQHPFACKHPKLHARKISPVDGAEHQKAQKAAHKKRAGDAAKK